MTQEDKELLMCDLCARLPFGVKFSQNDGDSQLILSGIWSNAYGTYAVPRLFRAQSMTYKDINIEYIKPYLRKISSMTEEEKKELQKITNNSFYASLNYISNHNTPLDGEWHIVYNNFVTNCICNKLISWLDKNHFDHRTDEEGKTLIEKCLALEAPVDMYKID